MLFSVRKLPLFIFFIFPLYQAAQAQSSDRWVIGEKSFEKTPGLHYSDPHYYPLEGYISSVFTEEEKWQYIFEYKDQKLAYSKFDSECRFLEEGFVQSEAISSEKITARLQHVVSVGDGFFLLFHVHGGMGACYAFVQKFDFSLRKAGDPIFLSDPKNVEKPRFGMSSDRHLEYGVRLSDDETQLLVFILPIRSYISYESMVESKHTLSEKYWVVNLKTQVLTVHPLDLQLENGFSQVIYQDVLNDGRVLVVVHRRTKEGKVGKFSVLYRLLGDPADPGFTEIPLPGVAINGYSFALFGNQLAFTFQFFLTHDNKLRYRPDQMEFAGIYSGKVDVITRNEISLRKLSAQEIFSSFPDLKFKKGVLQKKNLMLKQTILHENGSTDIFLLAYYYTSTAKQSNTMFSIRMDKNDNLEFVRAIPYGVDFQGSTSASQDHDYEFYAKNQNTYILTFEDKDNVEPGKKYVPVREIKGCVLSVTRIDPTGEVKKWYGDPIERKEKHFVNFKEHVQMDPSTDRMYFFLTRRNLRKFWVFPSYLKIPLD